MTEVENLMLEHLRAIRGDIRRIQDNVAGLKVEMTATRHHISGMSALQDHDHAEIAEIKTRLERIERRLELVDEDEA